MAEQQPGYSERDDDATAAQTGGDPEELEGAQGGSGRAHTSPSEGHPAGDGARSDREVGGPTAEEGAEGGPGTEPGAHGDIPTKGFDSHS